jgi:CheY-like chemotaxis protein
MPAILWQADAATLAFTYVGGATPLLGFLPEHWLTTPQFFSERIHPDDRGDVMSLFQAVTAVGGEASAEYRAIAYGGSLVWCRETIRVPAPGEGPRSISGVLTAIGQRRQLEAQSFTAGRVDALRHLSARLAHDLNNPLMIVTGYGEEMLNSLPEADPLRADVREMLAATNRVTELASQLLTYTRVQAKPPVRISLLELFAGLEPKLREAAREAIELVIGDADVWAYADPGQLEEAILALAAEELARVEAPSGPAHLHVYSQVEVIAEQVPHASLKPGVYSRITVQDGVTAFTPEVLESFLPSKDPRHTAESAIARAYLNIRQWGGDLITSGGDFVIYLPYAEPDRVVQDVFEEELVEEEIPAPVEEPTPVAVEPAPETILVVEDEPGIRALVRKILRRERYTVLEAGSAEEALEVASSHLARIDLLLTDVMLPAMNGRALAEAMREDRPDLKVIYVSGYTDDESVRTGDFPPGSKFLPKPFTLGALTGKVREALES